MSIFDRLLGRTGRPPSADPEVPAPPPTDVRASEQRAENPPNDPSKRIIQGGRGVAPTEAERRQTDLQRLKNTYYLVATGIRKYDKHIAECQREISRWLKMSDQEVIMEQTERRALSDRNTATSAESVRQQRVLEQQQAIAFAEKKRLTASLVLEAMDEGNDLKGAQTWFENEIQRQAEAIEDARRLNKPALTAETLGKRLTRLLEARAELERLITPRV